MRRGQARGRKTTGHQAVVGAARRNMTILAAARLINCVEHAAAREAW